MRENFEALEQCDANYVPLSPISFLNRAAEVFGPETAVVYGDARRTGLKRRIASGVSQQGFPSWV